jgi:hypothetical protein
MVRPGAHSGAFPLASSSCVLSGVIDLLGVSEGTAGVGSRIVIEDGPWSGVGSLCGVKNGTTMSTGNAGPATGEGN